MQAGPAIAIIGSGMAGIACARRLARAGLAPVVLDKGRGMGGRLATRRVAGGLQFDHGAQYVTARGDAFKTVLQQARAAGAVAHWNDAPGAPRHVGVPGMNALVKHLAAGLDIRQRVEVTAVRDGSGTCLVETATGALAFDRVVVTAPAPQAMRLLGADSPLARRLTGVRYHPCLTLMAATSGDSARDLVAEPDPDAALAWLARDSSKPGRPDASCLVAQAGPDWSVRHLEDDRDEIARLMLPLLCERLGIGTGDITYAAAHRWRYARVADPLGQSFACNASRTIHAGGDWCIGARVECAWTSGDAIARNILDTL